MTQTIATDCAIKPNWNFIQFCNEYVSLVCRWYSFTMPYKSGFCYSVKAIILWTEWSALIIRDVLIWKYANSLSQFDFEPPHQYMQIEQIHWTHCVRAAHEAIHAKSNVKCNVVNKLLAGNYQLRSNKTDDEKWIRSNIDEQLMQRTV